jgi:hypothetical protein
MNPELELYRSLEGADNFDDAFESDSADVPLVAPVSQGVNAQLVNIKGNPRFRAQFDISIDIGYYDVTGTAVILPAALPAALQTKLAFPLFGNSDFDGGFKLWQERLPVGTGAAGTWAFSRNNSGIVTLGSTVNSNSLELVSGDLNLEFTATVAANDYAASVRVRCKQVAYGTLLGAISSDRFIINNIRYGIADATKVSQYDNNIVLLRQSLFGKAQNDNVSPSSFKRPDQFQTNVVDIPLKKGIDKETIMASYINYDATSITWSIFVIKMNKVQERI